MRTVWKYPLDTREVVTHARVPKGGIVQHLDVQDGQPCLWIEVDPADDLKPRVFQIVGTGNEIPARGVYCGTFMDSPFVWHVYEVRS